MKLIILLICMLMIAPVINTENGDTLDQSLTDEQMRVLQTQSSQYKVVTQNTTTTDSTTNSTTTNSTTDSNTTETNTTQTPETQCQKECSTLAYYSCSVCYQKCTTTSASSVTANFTMTSCSHTSCKKYKSQPRDQSDETSTVTECSQWETQSLSEAECTQTCCNSPSYNTFTLDTWYNCAGINVSKTQTSNLIGLIVGSVLGGLLVITILLIVFCCCKDKISLCCQNSCWCFTSLFTGKYVTQYMKKHQTSTKNTTKTNESHSQQPPSAQSLNRNQLKWTKINVKTPVSQITTSKYFIQSQYEINPQIYCAICLDDLINCKTSCGHNFHFQCLRINLKKKFKCPQCDSKSFNPLKIICTQCREKQTPYTLDKNNINIKYPNFCHQNTIICEDCLNQRLENGSREMI